MTYSGQQLAALVKMGISMAAADGRFADEEKIAIVMELANFDFLKVCRHLCFARQYVKMHSFFDRGAMP